MSHDKPEAILAAGIRQYLSELATELAADDRLRLAEGRILNRIDVDADSIANYLIEDGLKSNGYVGWIVNHTDAIKPRVYTDEDHQSWSDGTDFDDEPEVGQVPTEEPQ